MLAGKELHIFGAEICLTVCLSICLSVCLCLSAWCSCRYCSSVQCSVTSPKTTCRWNRGKTKHFLTVVNTSGTLYQITVDAILLSLHLGVIFVMSLCQQLITTVYTGEKPSPGYRIWVKTVCTDLNRVSDTGQGSR